MTERPNSSMDRNRAPADEGSQPGAGPVLAPITVRVPKAIELTGISRTKLYELIKAKELEVIKVGASTLIVVASLHRFVERRRSSAA
jgi:excisionase family DNA binding protein